LSGSSALEKGPLQGIIKAVVFGRCVTSRSG
jgi:hypothetical protein